MSRMHTANNVSLAKLQKDIDNLTASILSAVLESPNSTISKEWLRKLIEEQTGKVVEPKASTVITSNETKNQLDESIERFITLQCKTKKNAEHFRCMLRMLRRFCLFASIPMTLEAINADRLHQFEDFLKNEHTFFDSEGHCIRHMHIYHKEPCKVTPQPRGINAVNAIMRRLRTFFIWAVKNDLASYNPFLKYKVPACVYGTPFFLTSEERDRLFTFDLSSRPALAVQRDIFVFQSNVGMRVGDFFELTYDNIVNEAVEYVANKTIGESGRTIRVPLSAQAKVILKRYQPSDRKELLPFISVQKYNIAIKEMLRLAGIDRVVTILNPTTRVEEQHPIWEVASSHMARRNFIGNLYNKTKDPNTIGSMTGHVDGSKAFARYRSIDDSVKKSLIDML